MITLEQLLASRDARAAFQHQLLEAHPGQTLVCITVQLPGSEKRNALSLAIGNAGYKALLERFNGVVSQSEVKDLETGYEAYFLVSPGALDAKRITCALEESHPLGRLMDIDVIGPEGPVSRGDIGLPPRKCLLCEKEVRFCMRAKSHSTEELTAKIQQMVNDYTYGIQKTDSGRN